MYSYFNLLNFSQVARRSIFNGPFIRLCNLHRLPKYMPTVKFDSGPYRGVGLICIKSRLSTDLCVLVVIKTAVEMSSLCDVIVINAVYYRPSMKQGNHSPKKRGRHLMNTLSAVFTCAHLQGSVAQ